jgi:cold shock CspA family protein
MEMMRFDGKLTAWNEASDSGVITPGKGGHDVVVHALAFPPGGPVPTVGEALSFEVETGADGQKRAHSVTRPQSAPPSSRTAARHAHAKSISSVVTTALLVLAAAAAVAYAAARPSVNNPVVYDAGTKRAAAGPADESRPARRIDQVAAARFVRPASGLCDGRTRCTQMNSCAEATFFLDNCPGAEMDGDRDGVPCESQWCTPGRASPHAAPL